ncbi:MAG: D-alanine--D-alanine ligase [Verrucomicrobiota bacterium]
MKTPKPIVVLKGGISSEREVSLKSGHAVATALREVYENVSEFDVIEKEFQWPSDDALYFVCLHGTYGEDGEIQERMESEGIAFTGSGSLGCRQAFDKLLAKKCFHEAGVLTAAARPWNPGVDWNPPYVLKPTSDGSSVGVEIVRSSEDVSEAVKRAEERGVEYMIENYVAGREFTVGVLGETCLPVVEVRPKEGFYDYKHKYTDGMTEHLCPAPLDADQVEAIQAAALSAHQSLGCTVYSRVDFILDSSGEFYALEVNTIPGMTPLSLLPEAAAEAGISFAQLCTNIIELSMEVRS